jgi:hypothetical protein
MGSEIGFDVGPTVAHEFANFQKPRASFFAACTAQIGHRESVDLVYLPLIQNFWSIHVFNLPGAL